jgi:hypothetical protein
MKRVRDTHRSGVCPSGVITFITGEFHGSGRWLVTGGMSRHLVPYLHTRSQERFGLSGSPTHHCESMFDEQFVIQRLR